MPVYVCKSSCSSCPALHRRTGPLAPRDNQSLAEGDWFFTDHWLLSTALTLSVPCSPMPMVSSVDQVAAYHVRSHPASVCLADHVLHGDCPDVRLLSPLVPCPPTLLASGLLFRGPGLVGLGGVRHGGGGIG